MFEGFLLLGYGPNFKRPRSVGAAEPEARFLTVDFKGWMSDF